MPPRQSLTERSLIARLVPRRPRAVDLGLALIMLVAAVIWVLVDRHTGSTSGPLTAFPKALPNPIDGSSPPLAPQAPSSLIKNGSDGSGLDPFSASLLANILATAPLAVRCRLPYAAFVIAFAGGIALRAEITWPAFIALLILAYSMVAYGRWLAVSLGGIALTAIWAAFAVSDSVPPLPKALTPLAILAPFALFAAVIRATRARADASARRALALERERDAATRAAMAEERARIARELHDVVSHHVSVMVVQAGAAGAVVNEHPELAARALADIGTSGRAAMAELRHLLGLVAPLDDTLHPPPGLAELDALVAQVRAAGQPVSVSGTPGALPQGVDLTAYRVVQEGLTNALRYAPGASTFVELSRGDGEFVVEVRNDAASAAPPTTGLGSGAGLVGLAERLRVYDGTLDCGHRVGGGFRLRARIPLETTT